MTDLWVVPPPSHSTWFAKIDWYMNWQMCKGLAHETRRPPVELLRLSEENGLPWFESPVKAGAPLMISAKGRIPAQRVLIVPFEKSLKRWLESLHKHLQPLQAGSLRVFVPSGSTALEAEQIWKSLANTSTNIEFTADEEATTWPTQPQATPRTS